MAQLIARKVRKVFPPSTAGQHPVVALNDVSFEAEGHIFLSLVGPSGCGKSTLLNIVSGVEHPTEGSVEVIGKQAGNARTGYVFQDPRLLPWKTVLENMLYVLDDGTHDEQVARARSYLDLVGLGASESR